MLSHEKIIVGRPGDLIRPGTTVASIACWHVGGRPAYPKQCGIPKENLLNCTLCNQRACFILYVSIPCTTGYSLYYIYSCTNAECGRKPLGSWRVLRCQVHKSASATTQIVENDIKSDSFLDTSGWGVGNTTDATSLTDFSDLAAALEGMTVPAKTPIGTKKDPRTSIKDDYAIEFIQEDDENIREEFPGFYLHQIAQPVEEKGREEEEDDDEEDGGGTSSDRHIQELLEKYGPILDSMPEKGDEIENNEGYDEEIGGQQGWEGEGYEEDHVLAIEGRKGVDRNFLRLMRKLKSIPDQCVRLGRSTLVWPTTQDQNLKSLIKQKCSLCGSARVLEMQLMAPLIAILDESAEWLESEGIQLDAARICRPPAAWDWISGAVFGCEQRCHGNGESYIEESIVLCSEE